MSPCCELIKDIRCNATQSINCVQVECVSIKGWHWGSMHFNFMSDPKWMAAHFLDFTSHSNNNCAWPEKDSFASNLKRLWFPFRT